MRLPRSIRTIRRLMILSGACAVVLACCKHPGDHRPGVYVGVCGISAGVCRNDGMGRYLGRRGEPAGWPYEMGVWSERPGDWFYGVLVRDGQFQLIMGAWRQLLL
jgi:hypothetical protein